MSRNHQPRMRIRAFPTAMNNEFIDNTWEMLQKALMEILHKNNSGLSFEELYRNAYTMVLHKRGDMLYSGLHDVVTEHLKTTICKKVVDSLHNNFLDTLNKIWSDHTTAMVMIRDILMYMDRVYVSQARVEPVYNLGLHLFRNEIISHSAINQQLKETLLNMIALERSKEAIEWIDLKNACQMLVTLGFDDRVYYEEQFESLFLSESTQFYRDASQVFLEGNSASVYIKKVNECLEEETQRSKRYLDEITELKIIQVLKDELITRHMQTVVEMENSGMVFMLTNERVQDLREMYELFKKVPDGPRIMTTQMSKFLRERGKSLTDETDSPNPIQFVQSLIDLKDQFDKFLEQSFLNDKEFKKAIQTDFEFFFNQNKKSPEFLSLYIDDKLKKGSKTLNEGDAERVLDKAMVLFKFLEDKDVFERYYKTNLAKRLLFNRSNSDDAEKSMILKLKSECGCQFTSKLEGMFKDMTLSESIMSEYRNHPESANNNIELNVHVLTQVYWPTTQIRPCKLPEAARMAFASFERFYTTKHQGRKIALNPALGTADLKATFYGAQAMDQTSQEVGSAESERAAPSNGLRRRGEETKILQVSTGQMVVLMQFNSVQQITFANLLEATDIPEKEAKKALQALAMGKLAQRILCRRGTGKEIEPSDVFYVNDAFTSKLYRIRVQNVSGRGGESDPERRETLKKVEDDRKHEIEAAIVRVMKARKTLIHNDLITEVTSQLSSRFMPDPMLIKKRIESLIEREYLKRDQENHKKYQYLA
ncbi:CULLIN-2 domain-containing protein [Aphelenchoides besseyi]|nr:CULLIN-2 domain-containing protein [Aphelenchoides besseyi]